MWECTKDMVFCTPLLKYLYRGGSSVLRVELNIHIYVELLCMYTDRPTTQPLFECNVGVENVKRVGCMWYHITFACCTHSSTISVQPFEHLRMTVANADSDNTTEEIQVSLASVVKEPLHVSLMDQ